MLPELSAMICNLYYLNSFERGDACSFNGLYMAMHSVVMIEDEEKITWGQKITEFMRLELDAPSYDTCSGNI